MAQQLWVTNTLGGYMGNEKLSEKLRFAVEPIMRFRQFCTLKEELGKNRNDTVFFDKISKVQTTGGTLVETTTMPRTNFIVGRGTAVVNELGNSVPFTGKLEALSEFNVDNAVHKVLRDDQAAVIDNQVATQFKNTLAKYVCSGTATYQLATAGSVTHTAGSATGHGNLNDYHIKNICDQLRTWNVPAVDNQGNFVCISSVAALRGIKDDSKWIDAYKYAKPEQLFTNECGKYYNCRFVEETNVLDSTVGGSSYGEFVFFGDDSVMEIVTIPEEVRYDIPKDFGRDKAIAWYALLGFKLVWCGTSTGDSVSTANGWVPHIIHGTSA